MRSAGEALNDLATGQPPFARRLLDALPFTIWSIDLDGRITAINSTWAQFAQNNGAPAIAPETAIVGCSVFSSMADDGAREQIERAMQVLRNGQASLVRWEFPCNSPDEERVFLMQVTALRDHARTDMPVTGFVFATVDITPSHRSREALINTGIALAEGIALDQVYEEVASQVRRAIPSTGFVIALKDADTGRLRVTHRQGFANESDIELETAFHERWQGALDATDTSSGATISTTTLDGVPTPELTAPLFGGDGAMGVLSLRARPFASDQVREESRRVISVIAAQTAVAIERARLVHRVEQKRRLEAIGEVAAGVAHELRNPLFGISSAAQLLQVRGREDPVIDRNVGRILREVERLNRMVTSLLEFGRPSTVHLVPGNPDQAWDDLLEVERARLATRNLIVHRTRSDDPVTALFDPEQFGQVLRNILVNACEHAPDGSTLELTSMRAPHGGWRCRLTNGGPAIPPDVLPHVFEFFYSARPGGTGIGLALCQRIMDDHAGTITMESSPDLGTTVTLTLPPMQSA